MYGTNRPEHIIDKKSILCIAIFIIFMIPLISGRYEILEPSSDAGVYTNRGLQILNERKLVPNIEVRNELDNKQRGIFDKDNMYYINYKKGSGGFLMGTHLISLKDSSFNFHAYPGWPILMALWGSIVGYEGMLNVMVLLYILVVFLFFLILSIYVKDTLYSIMITIMFGSTPLLVYFSKYTTSELFLLFLALYAFFLVSRNNLIDSATAGLSVTLFSFSHVSNFAYTPLLLLLNILLFSWKDARRSFNASVFIATSLLGCMLSIPYGIIVSRNYFFDIYKGLFSNPRIGVAAVLVFELLCFALSLISFIYFRKSRFVKEIKDA
jgi:hypothetical protein